jgi:integrase
MARPHQDGSPGAAPRKRPLTDKMVLRQKPEATAYNVWDTREPGLVLRVQPTGHKAFKFVYSRGGAKRWVHIGWASLDEARAKAAKLRSEVREGKDPLAERQALRMADSFAELADRYLELYAKKRNKSWRQGRELVERYLLPRWGKLKANSISRADVRRLFDSIEAPILANQVLAAASAVFSWAVKQEEVAANPCRGIERNQTAERERVLSDSELPRFWAAFDTAGLVRSSALKVILLCGQRPGEVAHMRREHIKDGWWQMPGKPDAGVGWPGTKNGASHRVWLSEPVRQIIAELSDGEQTGYVFGGAVSGLDGAMRDICERLGIEDKARPHDLRRTNGTAITRLKFGRDAMNRIQNHREGGIADVYDRHDYEDENRRIMDAVASHLMALAEGRQQPDNVVTIPSKRA